MFFKVILFGVAILNADVNTQTKEVEYIHPDDKHIMQLIIQEVKEREIRANLPVCPIDPFKYWNVTCA